MDNNWTIKQTKQLFDLAARASKEGKGLNWAFTKMAQQTGRGANSVRNYYYSQLKMFELVPSLAGDLGIELIEAKRTDFELFSKEEIDSLMRTVLTGKAAGKSVRALIAELAGADQKKALRLQNKYRSMLVHHKAEVTALMETLREEGVPYYDPYRRKTVEKGGDADNIGKLTEYIQKLDDASAGSFLNLIKKLL